MQTLHTMYFKPSYRPHNGAANILVKSLSEELGLSLSKKYEIVLASFLAVAKKVNGKAFDWWTSKNEKTQNNWSLFPHVCNGSITKIYELLMEHHYIEPSKSFPNHVVDRLGFGKPNWIKAKGLPKHFLEQATFIEANLPLILINQPNTPVCKIVEPNQILAAQKLNIDEVNIRFGSDYQLVYRQVKEMNDFWLGHPLYNPIENEFYSSVRRIFHNGSLKAGGRFYGGWTDIKQEQMFSFTIDGRPVAQVKFNAILLSLLSSLTGKPVNMIGTFEDLYHAAVFQISSIKNARNKVKAVIMDMMVSGNPFKENPLPKNKDLFDNIEEFLCIRDLCLKAYPALKSLDNDCFNFFNDLSYHGSEILSKTLLSLKSMGIIAYPKHDSLLVQIGNEFDAVEVCKNEFKNYVSSFQKENKLPELGFDIAFKVKFDALNHIKIPGSSS